MAAHHLTQDLVPEANLLVLEANLIELRKAPDFGKTLPTSDTS